MRKQGAPWSISIKIAKYTERASWIRKMFEEGAWLRAERGRKCFSDFTIGNPSTEP
ncbi:MAG: hypothetical protein R2864_06165 [Syntrophotaleaceae bacterium]